MNGILNKELLSNPRSRRILLATLITFIALSLYFTLFTYHTLIKNHQESTLLRLMGIVNSTALLIDGDLHTKLMSMYPHKDDIDSTGDDMYYGEIHSLLKKNESANMLKTPLYTIVYDSAMQVYEFGVSSADKPYFRHIYKNIPSVLMIKYEEGGVIPPYKDEFGHWLSAFAPIRNKEGKTVAVLQADEKYDSYISMISKSILNNIVLSLIMLGGLFFVLLRILHHILSRELKDKTALHDANETNKNISLQLSHSLDELKKTDEFRKEMIANFSHDLRTPLASVSGYLELVLNDENHALKKEDTHNYIKIAHSEAQRLKRLVSELFDLSKLESGNIKLNPEFFSMPELVQDVLNKYELAIKEKNINLITDFGRDCHLVQADIGWIDRLLQNLLDNAIRHCNNHGFVKITIDEDSRAQSIKVCNSGDPIPKADLPHVFDRYFKSSNRTSQDTTGLGLAIVKKIIDLHLGEVRAEVNDGVTTFRFILPILNT